MNNIHNQNNTNTSNANAVNTVKKDLMRRISIVILLLVVIYGGYLSFKGQFNQNENLKEGINTKSKSYVFLNDVISKLNFKNSNIEKYSFELNTDKYNGYSIVTVSYVGVDKSPFNEELKNSGFIENSNDLAEGHIVGLSVYSKDNLICIIKNDAVNPNSWGTDNPDYSSTQTFACADKTEGVK